MNKNKIALLIDRNKEVGIETWVDPWGLFWQLEQSKRKFSWVFAQEYAECLGAGWRVPEYWELLRVHQYAKGNQYCPLEFHSLCYWTANTSAYSNIGALAVAFRDGRVEYRDKTRMFYVRYVIDVIS
jgi:Protein of unknown function (DUF1566)